MNRITVALVDDHRVVAASLKAYLESFPDLRVAGIARSGEELLAHLTAWAPQVVLQDLVMPGGMDGLETIRKIRELSPGVRAIALTAATDEARMIGALRAGAAGYVRKNADPEVLLAAVRAVARGGTYVDFPRPAAEPEIDQLTIREREVLRLVALGQSNKEIANALVIGEETVKTHVGNVLQKLQAANRAQAIVHALKRDLVSLEELA